jgi:hypothetical protein
MSTENSQALDPTEDHRYADICGATNRNGNPCKLPAGWGTPGSGGTRCKFHGGLSSGPDNTSHLEENDSAKDNPGGRPPENNDNAAIHAGLATGERPTSNSEMTPHPTAYRDVGEHACAHGTGARHRH